MKNTMLWVIMFMIAIILMVSFDISLTPNQPVQVPLAARANALYVCPAASEMWDAISNGIMPFKRYINITIIFSGLILLAIWGWALYQNLLKDKFNRDSFKKPWGATKFFFWCVITIYILVMTPNYFRTVHITGSNQDWVLCENNTPGARPVRANAVKP